MTNTSLYGKLFKAQKQIKAISKDSTNPFFKSKYFDINKLVEEIKPILDEVGLLILQPLTNMEDGSLAISTIIIDPETGEEIFSKVPVPQNDNPQKMGSIITYYRRYCLQSLLFLQAEDDDANLASKSSPPPKVTKKPNPKPVTNKAPKPPEAMLIDITALMKELGKDEAKMLEWAGIKKLEDISYEKALKLTNSLKDEKRKATASAK